MPSAKSAVAVLGFRPHTYWTATVALAGPPDAPQVIERRKIVFAAGEERFVYHRAAEMEPQAAAAMIARVRTAVEANARHEIERLLADLAREGIAVRVAVVPAAIAKLPERLEDIVKVHARMHAAEGSFYRDAVAAACAAAGLQVRRVVERELPALAGDMLGLGPPALTARLKAMGASLGPPWSEDQKLATLAAWLHLTEA
jgi:hypothetical protein